MMIKFEDNMYIIAPSSIRKKILLQLAKEEKLYQITFASLEEVKKHYFFDVKKEAVVFLLEQTNENLDIIRTQLSYLPVMKDKTYQHSKLKKLQNIKEQLKKKGMLQYDLGYQEFLKTKKVVVIGYQALEPYEKKMLEELNAKIVEESPLKGQTLSVTRYENLYDEVVAVATKIRKLNAQGISYCNIFLAGIDDSYEYYLREVFRMFDIPLTMERKNNILTTIEGKTYLETKDIELVTNEEIKSKISIIEKNLDYAKNSKYYDLLLKDALANTYLEEDVYYDSVCIANEALTTLGIIEDNQYLFVLGLNQNKIPVITKDEDYLSDQIKKEIGLYQSYEKNKQVKNATKNALQSVKNIFLSYKKTSLQEEFYPSTIISELKMLVEDDEKLEFNFSEEYNQYHLARLLDDYYKYNQTNPDLSYLIGHYESNYGTYNHKFKTFKMNDSKLILSYSHLDDYALCPFRYYIKYVLKLIPYQESFPQKLGNIYHEVLSHIYDTDFEFEKCFVESKNKVELSIKDEFLLKRLKDELLFIITIIKKQEETTLLKNAYVEKKLEIELTKRITIKGFIDKILYLEKNNKTYYAFMDYKTGSVELNLDYLDNGLHLQLPIYLYLIEESNIFNSPVFSGFFYQMLLKGNKDVAKKETDLKLLGYTASEEETLIILDENYEKSDWIKGLSIKKDGNLSAKSKVINQNEKDRLKDLVKQQLIKMGTDICNGKYQIEPKIVNRKNISCEFCPCKEICFHDSKDNKYIEKMKIEV